MGLRILQVSGFRFQVSGYRFQVSGYFFVYMMNIVSSLFLKFEAFEFTVFKMLREAVYLS